MSSGKKVDIYFYTISVQPGTNSGGLKNSGGAVCADLVWQVWEFWAYGSGLGENVWREDPELTITCMN